MTAIFNSKYHNLDAKRDLKAWDIDSQNGLKLMGMISYIDLKDSKGVVKSLLDVGIMSGFIKFQNLPPLKYRGYINIMADPMYLESIGLENLVKPEDAPNYEWFTSKEAKKQLTTNKKKMKKYG